MNQYLKSLFAGLSALLSGLALDTLDGSGISLHEGIVTAAAVVASVAVVWAVPNAPASDYVGGNAVTATPAPAVEQPTPPAAF